MKEQRRNVLAKNANRTAHAKADDLMKNMVTNSEFNRGKC